MKINHPSIPRQDAAKPQEQRKTQPAASEPRNEDEAVVLNVSARRAIESPDVEESSRSFPEEAFSALKNLILGDPDAAFGAQSHSTPERVLQLLS